MRTTRLPTVRVVAATRSQGMGIPGPMSSTHRPGHTPLPWIYPSSNIPTPSLDIPLSLDIPTPSLDIPTPSGHFRPLQDIPIPEGTWYQSYPPTEGGWYQAYQPLPLNRMTDTCENITFPNLLRRAVKIK